MQNIPIRASRQALAPIPRILPGDMDKLLEQRAQAHVMVTKAWFRPRVAYEIVRRQGDYARRLDTIAAQRGQE